MKKNETPYETTGQITMSQITTHILDTAQGKPASGVKVELYQGSVADETENLWLLIGDGVTDSDGRVAKLLSQNAALPAGRYKLRFDTMTYFNRIKRSSFYPFVEIVFQIKGDGQHYHVPLLLNPFGYSTYRGS